MVTHSYSKRTARACPQVESTIYLGITAPALRFTARIAGRVGNVRMQPGETCIAVKSLRRERRYYIVHFNAARRAWQCSCGQNFQCQDHIPAAKQYAESHDIDMAVKALVPAKAQPSLPKPRNGVESTENPVAMAETTQTTPIDWKAVQKRDKARQKAWRDEYLAKVRGAQAQDARMVVTQ